MMKQLSILIFCSLLWHNVYAEKKCDAINVSKTEGSVASQGEYTFTQQAFATQKSGEAELDLVILQTQANAPAELRRVTFARSGTSEPCYFQPLAFMQGGTSTQFWGWHLLWAETTGLFYARMDGEAWVSSLPKRFTKLAAVNPQFKLDGQHITVTWQQVENGITANIQAVSSDEGRSWEINPAQP